MVGGSRIRLAQPLAQGHPVALNFFAGLCPPCRVEMPDLQALPGLRRRGGREVRVDDRGVMPSKILHWYAGDFAGREGVLRFIAAALPWAGIRKES